MPEMVSVSIRHVSQGYIEGSLGELRLNEACRSLFFRFFFFMLQIHMPVRVGE